MKKLTTNILLLAVGCFTILSCEREIEWQVKNTEAQMVIDALITNEPKRQSIYLYHTHNQLNEEKKPISGATIKLKSTLGEYQFTEEIPGTYTCPQIIIPADSVFQLSVLANGKADTAYAKMGSTNRLGHLSASKVNANDSLFYCSIDSLQKATMTEILYDWSEDSTYTNIYGAPNATEYRYNLNNVDVASLFPADKNRIHFPYGTKIIRRQFGISEGYAEYLRSVLMETNWRGGIFDIEHANAFTNFQQGSLGWFAMCELISDTTTIQILQSSKH